MTRRCFTLSHLFRLSAFGFRPYFGLRSSAFGFQVQIVPITLGVLLTCLLALPLPAQLPAFPGAMGFGAHATGGRGGTVYHVTHLGDTGAGSFRDAVSQPNRTVVFDVGGIIDYQPPRYNIARNVTIAGQTAPGDGVVLYGDGIGFTGSHNTITRFIRFRMGHDAVGEDAVGIAAGHDMIFDHISVSWSLDEVFSISGSPAPTNITIQSSIIAQGLQDHSAGGLIQTDGGVSIARCLYIDNGTRNPKVKEVNEFVNNVVYNWETAAYILGGESEGDSYANAINNYFINGPGGTGNAFTGGNLNFHIYASNNWQDSNRDGLLNGALIPQAAYGTVSWQTVPYSYPITSALPPLTALKLAVSDVGASWRRDAVDERLLTELTSWGVLGETIRTEFDPPMNGPGAVKGGAAPLDTDQDGMPDYWEAGLGMSTNSANNNDPSAGGYTKLEDYLNWLAEPHGVARTGTTVHMDLRQFTRGFTNFTAVYSVANPTNGTVSLLNGCYARFVPTAGFIGQAGFQFTVTDAAGSTLSRQMKLFFTPLAPAFNPVWRGDGTANNWNTLGDYNWFDGQSLLYPFMAGDAVTFDDTGSANPAVNLVGALQPAFVVFDASRDYALSGTGSLDGAMVLSKTGVGTLTLNNMNSFTGATVISNGTLLVHGSLNGSAVTVQSGGTIGGSGRLGQGLTVRPGGAIAPGNGLNGPGTLTISNGLTETGGALNRFELSNDPTGLVKTNDQLRIVGNLSLSGSNSLYVTLLDGPLANGLYKLITYSGSFSGSLANLILIGANGTLTNPPGLIGIHVDNARGPASLVWAGNGVNNVWDTATNATWRNRALPDWFYFGDSVRFDDAGSATPSITIGGVVSPASTTVGAAKDYTFTGSGRVSGTGGLTKTNSGTLTVLTANDYTGPTTVAGGTLAVPFLANGGAASGIGAAGTNAANLVLDVGTLRYTGGTASTDRGLTLNSGGGTVEVTTAAATLMLNGMVVGVGALAKRGAGTLTVSEANTYSGGTVVTEGKVLLSHDSGLGTGTLTLNGTTNPAALQFGINSGSLANTLNVIGTNNFTSNNVNNTVTTLVGSGTLTLNSGTTFTFGGNMSAFSGTIKVGTIANPRFHGSTGSANAIFDLGNTSAYLNTRNGVTAYIGALIGGSSTILRGAESADASSTYYIGGKNLDTTFAGRIQEKALTRVVNIVKVGTGTWTLTGASTYTGTTTVTSGTLLVNNTTGTGTGTNSVTVNNGGRLGGTGFIHGPVVVNSGGALVPGGNGVGTLTLRSNLTLNAGVVLSFELGATNASDKVVVGANLVLGGTLNVTNLAGFGAGSYTLISYGGALTGTVPTIGSMPAGYAGSISTNTTGQVRLIVQLVPSTLPTIGSISVSGDNVLVSGTGGPSSGLYYVLTATNIGLPMGNWTRLSTNPFDADGSFTFTNALNRNTPQRFFRVNLP